MNPQNSNIDGGKFCKGNFSGNRKENKTEKNRIIITCAWRHNSYEDIEKRLLDGTLVNWEQNEKNKRIKFV